jgi:hypothetical protein
MSREIFDFSNIQGKSNLSSGKNVIQRSREQNHSPGFAVTGNFVSVQASSSSKKRKKVISIMQMKENIIFMNYKGLSQEELEKLPVNVLAQALSEAIKEWEKLNQRVNQDSRNSNRAPSTDSPEVKAKRKAEEKAASP